jgi:eukaryotic-like serine/threonine-protein kinase
MTQGIGTPGQGGGEKQLQPGTVLLDRYSIQDVVGLGGMGSVYRARDLHFPNAVKLVAVKEMINQAPDPLVRQTIVQNFEREANILVTLSHISIPKIFDYFTFDERSYLVLEFVHGKDLEAVLNETVGFLSEDRVVGWAIELCDVLNYLHNHKPEPIIFRDMKPSNVMVNQHGHIVLIDFGIAKNFKSGQRGTMIGTEGYSPPEQYRGEATPLADIYSLGATLHHLLTRRDPRIEPPFTFSERPVRSVNPAVSVEIEAVINTALQYNPQDRYQSAEEMKQALLAAAKKTGSLNRISVPISTISSGEQVNKPVWRFTCEDEIRGTPLVDNNTIYVGSYDNNIYALDASNGRFLWKFPSEGGIVGQPILHEGVLYFGSEDGKLYAVTTRTGKLLWTFATNGPIRSSPRMMESHVMVGSDDGFLHVINPVSMRKLWTLDAGAPIRSTPFVTSDFIYVGAETGEFYCLDYRGEIKWRFRAKRPITASPSVSSGAVYFSSVDSNLYAVDAKTGWPIWRFRMGKGSVSSPCRTENFVFVGSADNYIYCIEASSAKEIWKYKTGHQVSGSPVVYKDSVFCGSADGNLYCLEYRTGRLRYKIETGGPITGSVMIANDIVYFGSVDHILYAVMA